MEGVWKDNKFLGEQKSAPTVAVRESDQERLENLKALLEKGSTTKDEAVVKPNAIPDRM